MKVLEYRQVVTGFVLPAAMMLAGCLPAAAAEPVEQPISTSTFTPCPFGTPEPLWVDPVISPTDQLTQVVTVYIGNGEQITVETESGTFTATGDFNAVTKPAQVKLLFYTIPSITLR